MLWYPLQFYPCMREERAKEAVELVRTLQAENEKLRAELKSKADLVFQQAKELDRRHLLLQEQEAELEQVKRERDAAIEAANGLDKMIGRAWGKTDMKRLTYFDGGKWRLKIGNTEYSGEAVDRLAAYEGTGLEPEEILSAVDMAKIACALHELNAYKELGSIDCLRKLAQADREGRCVVLPAKPDQTIYQWRIGDDCPSVSRLDGVQINADGEITYPIWNGYLIAEDFAEPCSSPARKPHYGGSRMDNNNYTADVSR